jgi:hypothetical protein
MEPATANAVFTFTNGAYIEIEMGENVKAILREYQKSGLRGMMGDPAPLARCVISLNLASLIDEKNDSERVAFVREVQDAVDATMRKEVK